MSSVSLGIDGLVSGLDTTSLINKLMQVEAAPQTLLKSKLTSTQSFITALQGLNTKVASLSEAATKAADPTSWAAFKATSSASSVTASAGSDAQVGSVSFTVDQVATSQVSVSAVTADDSTLVTGMPPSVTVRGSDGTLVTVEPTSGSLQDIARAINNAADAGIKATVVRVSGGDTPTYRLQFTGNTTGLDGRFEVYAGDSAAVSAAVAAADGGDPTALDAMRLDGSTVRSAQDAQITLWQGSAVEQTFTQSSNTFSDLMTGVDVTVTEQTTDPVTVTVAKDTEALTSLVSGLVGAMGVVLSEIASRTATTTTTNNDGTTSVTGGVLSGDSAVRSAQQLLTTALLSPADGFSPSEIGIEFDKDGAFTFDEDAFNAALAADPAKVQSMATQLAQRVADASDSLSDKYDGSLTLKITSQESLVKDYGSQIDDWDRRLALRREALQTTYSNLEVTLSNMQSQSSWLASQLSSLSTSTA